MTPIGAAREFRDLLCDWLLVWRCDWLLVWRCDWLLVWRCDHCSLLFVRHRDTSRQSNTQDPDFSFAWSLIHEMGAVAAGAGATIQRQSPLSLWSMLPANMSDSDRLAHASEILSTLCESVVLEMELRTLLSTK